MKFLEKDLEDIIFNADNESLQSRGLEIRGFKKRQLNIGNYGIADIVTFERSNYIDEEYAEYVGGENKTHSRPIITVYELKKNK